ncbi:MAG: signal recognition particle-docking protein FtsY [Chitinophagales bacterium]
MKQSLSKTRQSIVAKVENLIKGSKQIDEEFFDELEEILIQSDLGIATSTDLVNKLRRQAKDEKLRDPEQVKGVLKTEIIKIMEGSEQVLTLSSDKPSIILIVGVNGVGKTTSIAKLAYRFKLEGKRVMLAAGDTFRAAAIEQLQVWADRIGVDLIKHSEGSDPAAVVFDAVSAAKARKTDILIIDTAGRLHNKTNLMEEIAKVRRVIAREVAEAPHEVLLVLDATTGQNALNQAKLFKEITGVTGIILTKLDGTAKGGIVIAIARELGTPVKMIGIGETMEDLKDFSAGDFIEAMFAD